MNGRSALLLALVGGTSLMGLFACGEASLKVSTPTPTPNQNIDCTFATGAQEVFATRDCGNAGCHLDPGAAELTLVSPTMTGTQLYDLLLNSGGSAQRQSACGGEAPECAEDPSNPPNGQYCCNRTVRPNHPQASSLLQEPFDENETTQHTGGKLFTAEDEEYLSIKCWIEDGAPNN